MNNAMQCSAASKLLQLCPTLCDPVDGSPPGFPVPGILQARMLEWVAISFSSAWKWKVKVKSLSHVGLFATPWITARQAYLSITNSRSSLRLTSIESVIPSSHLILGHPLLLLPPIFQAPGSFLMSWLFTSGSQSFRTSTSASILPMYIQGWFLLGLTGLISLLSKELSRVFSSTTVWKHQFFSAQPSLWFNSHICTVFR